MSLYVVPFWCNSASTEVFFVYCLFEKPLYVMDGSVGARGRSRQQVELIP